MLDRTRTVEFCLIVRYRISFEDIPLCLSFLRTKHLLTDVTGKDLYFFHFLGEKENLLNTLTPTQGHTKQQNIIEAKSVEFHVEVLQNSSAFESFVLIF